MMWMSRNTHSTAQTFQHSSVSKCELCAAQSEKEKEACITKHAVETKDQYEK